MAGYGLIGKKAPEMVVGAPKAATKDTIADAWRDDYGQEPPASVLGK
jgi:ribose transport system substrate-binding protein